MYSFRCVSKFNYALADAGNAAAPNRVDGQNNTIWRDIFQPKTGFNSRKLSNCCQCENGAISNVANGQCLGAARRRLEVRGEREEVRGAPAPLRTPRTLREMIGRWSLRVPERGRLVRPAPRAHFNTEAQRHKDTEQPHPKLRVLCALRVRYLVRSPTAPEPLRSLRTLREIIVASEPRQSLRVSAFVSACRGVDAAGAGGGRYPITYVMKTVGAVCSGMSREVPRFNSNRA